MKFTIPDPENPEEFIGLQIVREFQEGRRYHRVRVNASLFDEMAYRLLNKGVGPPREAFKLHTPAGTVTVVADEEMRVGKELGPQDVVLQVVPGERCRQLARAARKRTEAAEREQHKKAMAPGRALWIEGKWAERCVAAAEGGEIGFHGTMAMRDMHRRGHGEARGLIDGFVAAARDDGFDVQFTGGRKSEPGTATVAVTVLWDLPKEES